MRPRHLRDDLQSFASGIARQQVLRDQADGRGQRVEIRLDRRTQRARLEEGGADAVTEHVPVVEYESLIGSSGKGFAIAHRAEIGISGKPLGKARGSTRAFRAIPSFDADQNQA